MDLDKQWIKKSDDMSKMFHLGYEWELLCNENYFVYTASKTLLLEEQNKSRQKE